MMIWFSDLVIMIDDLHPIPCYKMCTNKLCLKEIQGLLIIDQLNSCEAIH